MISTDQIANLVKTPHLIAEEHIDDLKLLCEKYPYTPVFKLLLIKALALHDQFSIDDYLKRFAIAIPNREQLYQIIHEQAISDDATQQSVNIDQAETVKLNDPEKEIKNEEEPQEIETSDLNDEPKEEGQDKSIPVVPDSNITKTSSISEDPLERQILAHAVGASISLEVGDDEELVVEKGKFEPQESKEETILDPIENSNIGEDSTIEQEPSLVSNKKSFLDWLSLGEEESKIENSAPVKIDAQEKKLDLPASKTEKNKKNIIVDKKSSKFFSPIEKARESLDFTKVPMTETLAKIYAAQGNFPKAIEAYQQLILKNPEKKSLFALLIEDYKKKLNK